MFHHSDTIIARSTPPGVGALAVLRMSGEKAFSIADALCAGHQKLPQTHTIRLRKFMAGGQVVDEGLLALFASPSSYTGEDLVEFYLHGSEFIVQALLEAAVLAGARLAEPGEFTRRAYLNGKMDLSQAEAVADVIASENAGAHRLAMNQLKGGISRKIGALRSAILEFAALVELELDFGEEDVEFADRGELAATVQRLKAEVIHLLQSFKHGNAIRDGVPVVIAGRPNAGKSTLLNVLLQEERAIVTAIPGTTRDTIEEVFVHGGIRFRLIDTAGLRESTDTVEKIGIQRAYESLKKAALVLLVVDASMESGEAVLDLKKELEASTGADIWLVANKSDLPGANTYPDAISIAASRGNIGGILENLDRYAAGLLAEAGDVTISNSRHAAILKEALDGLGRVEDALQQAQPGDMLAFELRNTMSVLGGITGEIDTEEVLGTIFSKFCIGK